MTSRGRVLAALEHREPDRVPVDIGGTTASTIVGAAYERLKGVLGVSGETAYMKRKSRTALLDEAVALHLHADTRPLLIGSADARPDCYFADGSFRDEFGVVWTSAEGGHFAPTGNPLREASLGDLARFDWPDPVDAGRTRGLAERARRLHEDTDYAIILNLPVGFVHLGQYLRGFDRFLMDLVLEPEFLAGLMDACLEWWLCLAAAVLDHAGPNVDVVMFGDDVAFQDRPMVDIARYRRWFKPRHRRMVDVIKAHSQAKVLYHCCGAVHDLVPEFVDIGVDALNPVQVSARGMDSARLKADFGKEMCFWGGIDTHSVLPHGSPEEVRAEVRRRIADLAPGGGYVLASVHNIQEDVPPENILAMADEAAAERVPIP